MTKPFRAEEVRDPAPRRITMERRYRASLDDVWDLWTTKEGLESWWGPEGFTVEVHRLDLRPGGVLEYAMTATGAEEVAMMKQAGMPLTTEARVTYTEVAAKRRLAYSHRVDFVPGLAPYDVRTLVELHAAAGEVRMVLTIDAMHDEQWTLMAVKGWESQLDKLAKRFAA